MTEDIVFECVVCGESIYPEEGDEFKHVQDSKTGKDLVFCGDDGTLLAQLIQMDLGMEELQGIRERVAELYQGSLE